MPSHYHHATQPENEKDTLVICLRGPPRLFPACFDAKAAECRVSHRVLPHSSSLDFRCPVKKVKVNFKSLQPSIR